MHTKHEIYHTEMADLPLIYGFFETFHYLPGKERLSGLEETMTGAAHL